VCSDRLPALPRGMPRAWETLPLRAARTSPGKFPLDADRERRESTRPRHVAVPPPAGLVLRRGAEAPSERTQACAREGAKAGREAMATGGLAAQLLAAEHARAMVLSACRP